MINRSWEELDSSDGPVDKCIVCGCWTDSTCARCLKYSCRKHKDKCQAIWDASDRVLPRILEFN